MTEYKNENYRRVAAAVNGAIAEALRKGIARPWTIKLTNCADQTLDQSFLRQYGMRLSDGPEYEFEKIEEIEECEVILVLENGEGEVVRIPIRFPLVSRCWTSYLFGLRIKMREQKARDR